MCCLLYELKIDGFSFSIIIIMITYFWPTKFTEEEKRERHAKCQRERYIKNRDKILEWKRKWYKENKELLKTKRENSFNL